MGRPDGPYGRLARFVLAHRKAVALAVAVLTLVALVTGLPPKVDSNLLELLPDDDPAAEALRDLHEEEGGVNLLTLSFSGEDPEALEAWLDRTTPQLEALDTVEFALHDVDEDLAFRIGLLQLRPADVGELSVRLKAALVLGPALNPIVSQRLMDMGEVTERIARAGDASVMTGGEGTARVMVRPTGPSNDPHFAARLIEDVEGVLEASDMAASGVELTWMGGAYRHIVEDLRGIQQDILYTSVASALLVLGVIVLTFRSLRATVLVFTPLLVANAVNLALVWAFIGSLNTYTSFGTAVLIGLGIDFAVHLVGRYREQRAAGREIEDAIAWAWDHTGPPCTTAALTSAAGFLALAVADFQGFSQLGVLLAMGLIVCLASMLVILPLLLPVLDPDPKALLGSRTRAMRPSRSTYRLAPVGLMVAVIATAVVGGMKLPDLDFEYDISQLRRDGLSYEELSAEDRALARDSYAPVILSYDSRAELTRDHRRLQRMVDEGELERVARVVSVESVLPADQEARNQQLEELARLVEHDNLRYLPPPIVKQLLPLRGFEARTLEVDDLPDGLATLVGAAEGRNRILLFAKGNQWDLRENARLMDELEGVLEVQPAGEFIAQGSLFRTVMRDIPIIGALALFLVAALTAIDLRKMHWVVGALGTLLAGMVWAGVAVQAVGVELSILNVVGIPILLGIGVDVVIHLLHRLAEEGPGGVRRALSTTGVAAVISTLTTVLSFTSLTLAGNRGVRSLGMLVVIGLIAVFIASAALLPLAWAAGWKVTGRAPADKKKKKRKVA